MSSALEQTFQRALHKSVASTFRSCSSRYGLLLMPTSLINTGLYCFRHQLQLWNLLCMQPGHTGRETAKWQQVDTPRERPATTDTAVKRERESPIRDASRPAYEGSRRASSPAEGRRSDSRRAGVLSHYRVDDYRQSGQRQPGYRSSHSQETHPPLSARDSRRPFSETSDRYGHLCTARTVLHRALCFCTDTQSSSSANSREQSQVSYALQESRLRCHHCSSPTSAH